MTTNECACLYVHRIIVPANVLLDVLTNLFLSPVHLR